MKTIMLMCQTADGKIARSTTEPATWTSKADKQAFVAATTAAGVVVFGRTTYETINRALPGRLTIVLSRHAPTTPPPAGVEYWSGRPAELLAELERRGYTTVVVAGGAATNSAFLGEQLVDELWLTIEPLVFGAGLSVAATPLSIPLQLLSCEKINDNTLQLKYRLLWPSSVAKS